MQKLRAYWTLRKAWRRIEMQKTRQASLLVHKMANNIIKPIERQKS